MARVVRAMAIKKNIVCKSLARGLERRESHLEIHIESSLLVFFYLSHFYPLEIRRRYQCASFIYLVLALLQVTRNYLIVMCPGLAPVWRPNSYLFFNSRLFFLLFFFSLYTCTHLCVCVGANAVWGAKKEVMYFVAIFSNLERERERLRRVEPQYNLHAYGSLNVRKIFNCQNFLPEDEYKYF